MFRINNHAYKKSVKKLFVYFIVLTLSFLTANCGVWRDFNTYFNTYYNAKTIFDNAEEQILKQKKDMFVFREDQNPNNQQGMQTNYIQRPQNPNPQQYNQQQYSQQQAPQQQLANQQSLIPAGQLSGVQLYQELTRVIEKCSKILQYETSSSYFPDALFMTGKAFYYQQEYSRAQRKFVELAGIPNTKYALENKLWLAKTHLQLHNFDEGLKLIDEVKQESLKDDNEKLFNEASITMISFLEFREEFLKAISECESYLKVSRDDEINALVCYEMGKIYLKIKNKEKALTSFAGVLNYSPTFDVEFQSRFEYAKLLKELNRIDESETAYNDLRYAGKFKNYIDQVLIEIGQLYYDQNKIPQAIEVFRDVDSTYKMNPTSGIAAMKLGDLYKNKIRDYDSSLKYYNKTAASIAPYDIKMESLKKAQEINKYFTNKNEIDEINVQRNYATDPSRFVQDSIEYDIAYRQYLDEARRMQENQSAGVFNQPQQNQQDLINRQQLANQQQNQKDKKNIPLNVLIAQGKYKKPVRPTISLDSLNSNLAKSYYSLGSLFFSELEVPDSAKIYFEKILNDYPNKPVKVQTMYSLGIYYETVNDTLKADSLFRYIYDNFEKDPLRNSAAQKLGLVKKEEKKQIVQTTNDPAENIYIEAEKNYYDKKYDAAIDSFHVIYRQFPKSVYAQKSLYYIGIIYEKDLKMYDSAAAAYGTLVKDYATSSFASAVLSKYTEYKNEKDRMKKEDEKKLQAENEQKLKTDNEKKEKDKPLEKNQIAAPAVKDSVIEKDDLSKLRINRPQNLEQLKTAKDTTKKKLPEK